MMKEGGTDPPSFFYAYFSLISEKLVFVCIMLRYEGGEKPCKRIK